ncbi:MAG: sigma-54-dependent transcriptional regulator, partial [Acidobacteriota bacterium]
MREAKNPTKEKRVDNRILVVDDDPEILELLQMRLESAGFAVDTAIDGEAALDRLEIQPVDLVITDLKMPGMDGLEFLRRLRKRDADLMTIFLTAHGSISEAVEAMKLGAYDFLEKPYRGADLVGMVQQALEQGGRIRPQPSSRVEGDEELLVSTKATAMGKVLERLSRVAPTPASVLMSGESGTGKELLARRIHKESARVRQPFVIIDCGALPDTLLESELFGHRKGSFTSATQDKKGLLEMADGGTAFLDEIGNISTALQTRLLRFLQNGEVRPVGDLRPRKVDVRVIAATNRDLEQATADGSFREDLYYRLKVVTLSVPPLRERLEDLPALVEHFLEEASRTVRRPRLRTTPEVMAHLTAYPWPGNVRELKHVIEAATALARGPILDVAEFLGTR